MARRKKDEKPKGFKTKLVFQHPKEKGFFVWKGPTVTELVEQAIAPPEEAVEEFKAITIRPTVQEVALLDQLAKLFKESRNVTARRLLAAAMREALAFLPDAQREKVQVEAFKTLGWGVMTPEKIAEINERGARGEGTPLSEICADQHWLEESGEGDSEKKDPEPGGA